MRFALLLGLLGIAIATAETTTTTSTTAETAAPESVTPEPGRLPASPNENVSPAPNSSETPPPAVSALKETKPSETVKSEEAKPAQTDQAAAKSDDAKPAETAESDDAKPAQTDQAAAESDDAKPAETAEADDAKPAETAKSDDAKPAAPKKAEGAVEGKPVSASSKPAKELGRRSVIILPSTDSSGLNLAVPLQYALAQLFQQAENFDVQISTYVLPGYTTDDVKSARDYLKSDLMSFLYFEKERLSVFLFDNKEPNSFIVITEPLTGAPGGRLDNTFIETKFRAAFNKVLEDHTNRKFQPLPSSGGTSERSEVATAEGTEADRKVNRSRMLFRELASIQDRPIYLGGSIGMARASAESVSSSTVHFGGHLGYHIGRRYDVEFGFDFFNHSMVRGDFRYHFSLPQRFMIVSAGLSVGKILSRVTRSLSGSSPTFEAGQMIFGPTASFNIPLLGTSIRGELRCYLGGGSIITGTYGISYSL